MSIALCCRGEYAFNIFVILFSSLRCFLIRPKKNVWRSNCCCEVNPVCASKLSYLHFQKQVHRYAYMQQTNEAVIEVWENALKNATIAMLERTHTRLGSYIYKQHCWECRFSKFLKAITKLVSPGVSILLAYATPTTCTFCQKSFVGSSFYSSRTSILLKVKVI